MVEAERFTGYLRGLPIGPIKPRMPVSLRLERLQKRALKLSASPLKKKQPLVVRSLPDVSRTSVPAMP